MSEDLTSGPRGHACHVPLLFHTSRVPYPLEVREWLRSSFFPPPPPAAEAPAMSGFQFPGFYQLPPFFTLQPNAAVRTKQLELWKQLASEYCKAKRIFVLGLDHELFRNAELQRQLPSEARRAVAEHLVASGAAQWAGEKEDRLLVLWRSVSAWADLIFQWATENGLIGSVETVQSLMDGEAAEGQEFYGAPRELIMAALQELSRRGRATIFRGSSGSEGVKFLPG
ncbi:unnamed protein product [Effrenium voratum]|nr:unnamed protein product [Effrenium voratum]